MSVLRRLGRAIGRGLGWVIRRAATALRSEPVHPLAGQPAPKHGDEVPTIGRPPLSGGGPGWKGFLKDLGGEVKEDRLTIIAGSLAYSGMLAVFPLLIAAVSIYGLAFSPEQVQEQIGQLVDVLPASARALLVEQLTSLTETSTTGLGIGLAVSLLAALWSASSGMKALVVGINVVHDESEDRSFLKARGLALAFTLGFLVTGGVAFAVIGFLPKILDAVGLGDTGAAVLEILRFPLMFLIVLVGLAALYRFAPAHKQPGWKVSSAGAVVAAVLWVIAVVGFAFYVNNFGKFDATYGTIGGVIVLLLFFFLSGFVVLLGAEIDDVAWRRGGLPGTDGG